MERPIIVVGAGVGGLAAALELAAAGAPVLLLEASDRPGGKAWAARVGGRRVDTGPTVLTWREVFDGLFERAGERLEDRVRLTAPRVLARHFWPDGSRLDLHRDPERSADAVAAFAGPEAARGFTRFLAYAGAIRTRVGPAFLDRPGPDVLGTVRDLGPGALRDFAGIDPLRTMWRALGRFFPDPRLRQLFGRYATYVGGSPFATPATYNLVAHVEQAGVWQVTGGVSALAAALAAAAEARGARLRFGTPVARIEVDRGRTSAVRLSDGTRLPAAAVVFNGDVGALGAGLLGPAVRRAARGTPPRRRSLSALTLALTAQVQGAPLVHHNVFFSEDYRAEFRALARGRLPEVPTVYVCAQDRVDGTPPPDGSERLLLIINAPPLGAQGPRDRDEEFAQCETQAFDLLTRCGISVVPTDRRRTTPADFARRFPGSGGALYGPSPHGPTAALRRSPVRARLPGLYLAGGSVHPGPGVPLSAMSGVQAARAILRDQPSISIRAPAVTAGGISTW